MEKICIFLISSLFITLVSCQCKQGWRSINGKCYLFVSDRQVSWPNAESTCESQGGALVQIPDPATFDGLQREARRLSGGSWLTWWTGLHRTDAFSPTCQSMWKWGDDTNSDTRYVSWLSEPNNKNGKEHCVEILKNGLANDDACTKRRGFICKCLLEGNDGCAPDWIKFGTNCYYFSTRSDTARVNWADARTICKVSSLSPGGDLLWIDRQEEKLWIKDRVTRMWSIRGAGGQRGWWIGANDLPSGDKGPYKWNDGQQSAGDAGQYIDWDQEPTNAEGSSEFCAGINDDGVFSDRDCFGFTGRPICQSSGPCMGGWVPGPGGLCYYFDRQKSNWYDARTKCKIQTNGDLVKLTSPDVVSFVVNQMRAQSFSYMWTGLNDRDQGQRCRPWIWSDGSKLLPSAIKWWNEPNNWGNKEHVSVIKLNGVFNDDAEEYKRGYACKMPIPVEDSAQTKTIRRKKRQIGNAPIYSPLDMVTSDPVTYFSIDDTSGTIIRGTNDKQGTLMHGAEVIDDGKVGRGLRLSGDLAWVDLGSDTTTCFGNIDSCPRGFTLAMWIRLAGNRTLGKEMYFYSSAGRGANSAGVNVFLRDNGWLAAMVANATQVWEAPYDKDLVEDEWMHVLVTWRRDEGVQLFINGDEVAEDGVGVSRPGHQPSAGTIVLGRPNDVNDFYAKGTMDEIIYWDSWKHGSFIEKFFEAFGNDLNYYMPFEDIRGNIVPGAGLQGTAYGGPGTTRGRQGKAIFLNGRSQYVNLGNFRDECFGDLDKCQEGATLAMWIMIGAKDDGRDMYYFSSGGQTETSHGISLLYRAGNLLAWMSTSTKWWKCQFEGAVKGIWHHVVLAWDEHANEMQMYVDGEMEEEDENPQSRSPPTQEFNDIMLGRPNHVDDMYGEVIIDELLFYEYHHGEEFIQDIYSMYTDHIYYMPMEKMDGDVIPGDNIQGTAVNNPTLVDGIVGSAIYLDGNNQYISLGGHSSECFGNLDNCPHGWTMSLWIKLGMKSASEMYYFSTGGRVAGSYGVTLGWKQNKIDATFSTAAIENHVTYAGPMKGQWHHVVLTWSEENELHIWVDGHEEMQDGTGVPRATTNARFQEVTIGKPNDSPSMYGEATIDELIFWDRRVSEERLKGLWEAYNGRYEPPTTCDEGWVGGAGKCFKFVRESGVKWSSAQRKCRKMKADLLNIRSLKVRETFEDLIADNEGSYWSGGKREDVQDCPTNWHWDKEYKSDLQFVDWEQNPNNLLGAQHCVQLLKNGVADDVSCTGKYGYICKYTAPSEQTCVHPEFVKFGDSCYYFSTRTPSVRVTWQDSRAQCKQMDARADLLTIRSLEEKNFIKDTVTRMSRIRPFNTRGWFIGLHNGDQDNKNNWEWLDDQTLADMNLIDWDREPNNFNGRYVCATMRAGSQIVVKSRSCGQRRRSMCQTINKPCDYSAGYQAVLLSPEKKCIKLVDNRMNWNKARAQCQEQGGDLLTIEDLQTHQFIQEMLTQNPDAYNYWLGLHDKEQLDRCHPWKWTDGTNMDRTIIRWNREPNSWGGNDHCASMLAQGVVDDSNCNTKMAYVCRYDTSASTPCQQGWRRRRNTCYWFSDRSSEASLSWDDARTFCKQKDSKTGDLVTFRNGDEAAWMRYQIGLNWMFVPGWRKYWIGLTDRNKPGTWEWVDGTKVNKRWIRWERDPNDWDTKSYCTFVYQDGAFHANPCQDTWLDGYVCQKTAGGSSGPTINCPSGWRERDGFCYFFSPRDNDNMKNWADSRSTCKELSDNRGDLVSIGTADESEWVRDQVGFLWLDRPYGQGWWTGLNDLPDGNMGPYEWTDNTPFDPTLIFWNENPNTFGGLKCGTMGPSGDFITANCDSQMGVLCQARQSGGPSTGGQTGKGLNGGQKFGIALAVIIPIVLIALIAFLVYKMRTGPRPPKVVGGIANILYGKDKGEVSVT